MSRTTTLLTLGFDVDPGELLTTNITITKEDESPGADVDSVSGTGTERSVSISNISTDDEGTLTVTVTDPDGVEITPKVKTVVVYVDGEPAPPDLDYYGLPKMAVSSISESTDMWVMESSGEAPFLLQASAENVVCTGTFDNVAYAINPITDLEHRWTVTKADESPVFYLNETKKGTDRTTVNPATDTIGPNLSVWLHEPGTYTVTRVSRAPDGVGGYTSFTKTRTITISAMPTDVDHYWYSNTGDNANDGRDPHGFALSAATYTESTGELTEVGAFSGLTLSNHKGDYDIFNGDKIYIPGFGQRTIVSKESDNTIIISPKLGSDQTGLTSSDGPRATWSFTNNRIPVNTLHHLKGGDSFSNNRVQVDDTSDTNLTAVKGFVSYDGAATILALEEFMIYPFYASGTRYMPKKTYFGKLILDPNGNSDKPIFGSGATGVMTGEYARIWFDQITVLDNFKTVGTSGALHGVNMAGNFGVKTSFALTNSVIKNITDAVSPERRIGIYLSHGPTSFESIIGNIVDNDAESSVLDHHYYPSGRARLHIGWDYCRGGRNNNFNYNVNYDGDAETVREGPLAIHDSVGFNSRYFADFSNADNDQFTGTNNYYLARNQGVENLFGWLFSIANRQVTALDNIWWSIADGSGKKAMFTQNAGTYDATEYHWKAARNLAVNSALVRDRAIYGPIGWQLYDNKVWTEEVTDGEGIELKVASLPVGVEVAADGNEVYAPIPYTLDGTEVTTASFNTAVGGTNTAVASFTLPAKPSID